MKHRMQGFEMSEKEFELLRYLHKVKIASYSQIHRDVYKSGHPFSTGRRIRHLENHRMVQGFRNRMLASGQKLMSLTKQGFDHFVARGEEKCVELKSDSPLHDLALCDIRHLFLKSPKTRLYLTENELQTWGHLEPEEEFKDAVTMRSDALLISQFRSGAVSFALEYECSLKNDRRYEDKVRKYYARGGTVLILFVSDQPSILAKVKAIEASLYKGEQPRFFYQLIDVLRNDSTLSFENAKHYSLSFGL